DLRADRGQAAAAPPSSEMKARRFMTDMGLAPPRAAGLPHHQPSTEGPAGLCANPESWIEVVGLPSPAFETIALDELGIVLPHGLPKHPMLSCRPGAWPP